MTESIVEGAVVVSPSLTAEEQKVGSRLIGYRFPNAKSPAWYVSEVKGSGGVDWGYSTDASKAVPLNQNQWKSFAKDMREVGSVAYGVPA